MKPATVALRFFFLAHTLLDQFLDQASELLMGAQHSGDAHGHGLVVGGAEQTEHLGLEKA
jgi:hypothetical protein